MIEFINRLTGTIMLVSDDRKEEYEAAGHKLAASASDVKKPETKAVKKSGRRK